ncbi:MAG: hypothetical protein ACE37N_07170 [Pseudohongiellaceae bacterium]
MSNYRYRQVMVPIDRYVRTLTPRGKLILALAEGSLLLVLLGSVIFYLQ